MEPEPQYHVHKWDPVLIHFTENWGIRYYGLAYVLGFAIAGLLLHFYWKRARSPLDPAAQGDLLFAIILGTLLGGRVGYFLFYEPSALLRDPLAVFKVWDGGMASHGGFIGVTLALCWTAWKHQLPVRTVGDVVVTLAPPGLMLGRIANYINGELWGKISYVPWAVIFPQSQPQEPNHALIPPRHPSQLYEAALEGLLLMVYAQWRIWRTPVVAGAPGRLAGEFLLGYAIVRVIGEQFREPDFGIEPFLGLNRGAWLSFGLAIFGVVLIALSFQQRNRGTENTKPNA